MLTAEPDLPKDSLDEPNGSAAANFATWAIVLLVGETCLAALVIVLGSVIKVDSPVAYVVAFGLATLAGGRVAGIHGWARWLLAAVLIVLVAVALAYLLVWIIVSGMTGP